MPTLAKAADKAALEQETALGLPRIAKPLNEKPDGIFMPSPTPSSKAINAAEKVGQFARSHGQSEPKDLNVARVVTPFYDALLSFIRDKATVLLKMPVGVPFRLVFRSSIAGIVLGAPYGELSIIVNAIDAISRLAIHSLKEDTYGNVQRDVRKIVKTFTNAIEDIEGLKKTLDFHWTDVERVRECPEVDAVLSELRDGLRRILVAFEQYSTELGITMKELRLAREAANPPNVVER